MLVTWISDYNTVQFLLVRSYIYSQTDKVVDFIPLVSNNEVNEVSLGLGYCGKYCTIYATE